MVSTLASATEPVVVHIMDIPPMSSKSAASHGVVGEIVLEAMRRASLKPDLVFMPTNRSILTVQMSNAEDVLILPIARSPEREGHFTWIRSLYKAERAFVTRARRITSFAEARASLRSVAIARGTVNLDMLRKQGFTPEQLYEISDNEQVPRMLAEGRMEAWFGPIDEMEVYLRAQPRHAGLVVGPALASTDNYVACSRRCNPALVSKLALELAKMDKDGTTKAIRLKHGAPKSAVANHK